MSDTFDVGMKILKLEGNKFLCEGIYFIHVDNDLQVAEILSNDEVIDELPIINSDNDLNIGILPGFLAVVENYMDNNDVDLFSALNDLQLELHNIVVSIKFLSNKNNNEEVIVQKEKTEELEESFDVTDEESLQILMDEECFDIDKIDIKEISKEVKKSIVGQDEVVDKILSNIIFNQKLYFSKLEDNDARLLKKNMLVFGKTGTGKTEIVKQIAKRLNVPFIIEDATNYTIEGYKGKDVVNMLKRLVNETDFDIDLAEHSILVIDEIDKKIGFGDDQVNSVGVLRSLLKIIEGEEMSLSDDRDLRFSDIVFNTSYLTVICLGHFENLYKDNKKSVGFIKNEDDKINANYKPELFIDIGMPPEFMGRITDIVKTNDLNYNQIIDIIKKSDISPLVLQKKFFDTLGVKVKYDDEFILNLAKRVVEKRTGARAIKSCFDEEIDSFTFEALSGDIKEVEFKNGKVRKRGIVNKKNNKETE